MVQPGLDVDRVDDSRRIEFASPAERARRLAALRDRMDRDGLTALVVDGRPGSRGRLFYVTDIMQVFADGFAIVLPDGDPIFVAHPVAGLKPMKHTTWVRDFRANLDQAAEVARALKEYGYAQGDIGVVGFADTIPHQLYRDLRAHLPQAYLTDATALFEEVQQARSDFEVDVMQRTCDLLREAMEEAKLEIVPGITEHDVVGVVHRAAARRGMHDVSVTVLSPPWDGVALGSDRTLSRDGVLNIWVCAGWNGFHTELSRCYTFGEPTEEVHALWELHREMWAAGLKEMKPGAKPSVFVKAIENIANLAGYTLAPEDIPFPLHGIGNDNHEGFWFPGKDRSFLANETVSVHPFIRLPDENDHRRLGLLAHADNVVVTEDGGRSMAFDRVPDLVVL